MDGERAGLDDLALDVRVQQRDAGDRGREAGGPDGKGLVVDATFYDPEAFTRPLHTAATWNRVGDIDDPERRYTFVECRTQSQTAVGPDGRVKQLNAARRGLRRLPRQAVGRDLGDALRAGLAASERAGLYVAGGIDRATRSVACGTARVAFKLADGTGRLTRYLTPVKGAAA